MKMARIFSWATWTLFVGFAHTVFADQPATADPPETPPPIRRADLPTDEITPGDVLARVGLLRDELELIRFETGKPKISRPDFPVSNAAPREVYFQARTLFDKVDRLGQDLAATESTELEMLPADILRPQHVWATIDAALARLLIVKQRLGITESCMEVAQPADTTPTDVFRSIVQANRQLNLMLHPGITPSDVFQQVETAINYADRLIETFPETKTAAEPPPFVRGKRPEDVYRRLVACFAVIETLAKNSNLKTMKINLTDEDIADATPADVFDLTSLIVSELAYLQSLSINLRSPARVHYPGRRFPSHVFQKAGVLEAQLQKIAGHAESHPDWLGTKVGNRE